MWAETSNKSLSFKREEESFVEKLAVGKKIINWKRKKFIENSEAILFREILKKKFSEKNIKD